MDTGSFMPLSRNIEASNRLAETTRSLIVDEIFDANDLDLQVIELALSGGISVTLVGYLWQALYLFRGARPEKVHELLRRGQFQTMPIPRSSDGGPRSRKISPTAYEQASR